MPTSLTKFALIILLSITSLITFAQTPIKSPSTKPPSTKPTPIKPPSASTKIPIDGGISWLLAAGLGLGIGKFILGKKREHE